MNTEIIEQGDKVFFAVDKQGSHMAIGCVFSISEYMIVFRNANGIYRIPRWLAEETTSLIEKAETLPEFSGIFGKLVNLDASIVA